MTTPAEGAAPITRAQLAEAMGIPSDQWAALAAAVTRGGDASEVPLTSVRGLVGRGLVSTYRPVRPLVTTAGYALAALVERMHATAAEGAR